MHGLVIQFVKLNAHNVCAVRTLADKSAAKKKIDSEWTLFYLEFDSGFIVSLILIFFSWNLLSFNVCSMSHLTYMHVHKQDTYTLIERNFVVFLSLQDVAFDVSRCASKGALWSPWTMEMNTTRRLWWRNSDLALPRRPDVCSEDYIEWLHRHARSN